MDMLGSFVRHGVPQRQVEAEVLFQIIAGSDTIATGIRGTLLYLLTTPMVLEKLRAEIDEGIRNGKISSPIANAEARELPYLQVSLILNLRPFPESRISANLAFQGMYQRRSAHTSAFYWTSDEAGPP